MYVCTCFSLHSTDEGYQELCKLSNLPSLHELKESSRVGTDGLIYCMYSLLLLLLIIQVQQVYAILENSTGSVDGIQLPSFHDLKKYESGKACID